MRSLAVALGACVVATIALAAIGWPYEYYYRHSDFMSFYLGSRSIIEGIDPYDADAWRAMHVAVGTSGHSLIPNRTGYGYPLTTAVLALPFALLPPAVAAASWFVAQIALAGAGLAALARRLFPATMGRDMPVLVAMAAASQPAATLAFAGNVGGFLLAIAAFTAAFLADRRYAAAGAVAGLALLKPHPFLLAAPLVFLLLPDRARWRFLGGAAVVSASVVAISLALRPEWILGWLNSAIRLQAINQDRANAWGPTPHDARWLGWILLALFAVVFLVWLRWRRPTGPALIAGVLPLSLFAAPYVWSYDHSVLFVTAAVCVAAIAPLADRVRAGRMAIVAAVFVLLPWLLYVLSFRLEGEEPMTALVPVVALAALAYLGGTTRGESVNGRDPPRLGWQRGVAP